MRRRISCLQALAGGQDMDSSGGALYGERMCGLTGLRHRMSQLRAHTLDKYWSQSTQHLSRHWRVDKAEAWVGQTAHPPGCSHLQAGALQALIPMSDQLQCTVRPAASAKRCVPQCPGCPLPSHLLSRLCSGLAVQQTQVCLSARTTCQSLATLVHGLRRCTEARPYGLLGPAASSQVLSV